tara:strand:- start:454 stop:867 length:414 start_codon:yes stop_codon:yes gene_type:complete
LNSKISDKDKKDWENFLTNKENLSNKDLDLKKNNKIKNMRFDLHGFSLENANQKIKELIVEAYDKQVAKLIIVTGKGLHSNNKNDPFISKDLGILKYSVPDYVRTSKELMSLITDIREASFEDGGSGAFYIFLKKKL